MYRYGRYSGYRRRRRARRLRILAIALVVVILVGSLLYTTRAGNNILSNIGLRGASPQATPTSNIAVQPTSIAAQPTSRPTTATSPSPGNNVPPTAVVTPEATPTSQPKPTATSTPSKSPVETAKAYIANWEAGSYSDMYKLLSDESQKQYDRQYFVTRYQQIAAMATIQSVDASLNTSDAINAGNGNIIRFPFNVTIHTRLVGDIKEQNLLTLVKEDGVWKVQWGPNMIFKDLSGDNLIRMFPYPAPRGSIYDRKGRPLAIEGTIAQIGVVPGQIKNEKVLLQRLSQALGVSEDYIKSRYQGGQPDWFMPIRDLTKQKAAQLQKQVGDIPGVAFQERVGREYPQGPILAQVIGYVGSITAEDLKKPEYKDYSPTDVVGRAGLEAWGEPYLRGKPGGKLAVVTPDGEIVKVIKEVRAVPGDDIYLNIDLDLQIQAEQELSKGGYRGAIVAMNPNNGDILALVSEPSYDPNDFVVGISQKEWEDLNRKSSGYPLINRATGSSYPMASTFKPISLAAALEAGIYKPTSMFYDPGYWNKLGENPPRRDWKPGGHGWISLESGLVQSCDIVFYEVGLALYKKRFDYLSEFAKKWWLGRSPDVDGVVNASGQVPGPGVPYPGWGPGDNVNLAIGQGALNVSPLQVAMVYSTIANGGTIYKPLLIDRIVAGDGSGKIIKKYKPTVLGRAPVSQETMDVIHRALKDVTSSQVGTAYYVFKDFPIPVAGKTGTGQQDEKLPFAWFAAYAPADKPSITVVALAENAGEGSVIAAPVVKNVLADYFNVNARTR